ncbi:MAG TPA: DUF4159 domain-containing protein [Gemmatimonadaceae bacterium]|nr:DUF4159 domain-containing protein [Gemmatimonadaceae bacterium]
MGEWRTFVRRVVDGVEAMSGRLAASRAGVAAATGAAGLTLVAALVPGRSPEAHGAALAQRQQWIRMEPNLPYDGRFTFARIRYTEYRSAGWAYDYPAMERNLLTMVSELTTLQPHVRGSNIHRLDDPDLLKYPVAYLSEPGYWIMSDEEVAGLRNYLAKGGFLIVDDFMLNEWANFERQMRRVLPDVVFHRLDGSEAIFDSFYHIESLEMKYPSRGWRDLDAEFLGIYEDNDPGKRMMVVINYNNDIGDYMEWSGEGFWPVNITNDAYKLAINYIIYGMTR